MRARRTSINFRPYPRLSFQYEAGNAGSPWEVVLFVVVGLSLVFNLLLLLDARKQRKKLKEATTDAAELGQAQ